MHKFLIIAATALSLTACTATQQGAAIGAGAGAIGGAALTGNAAGTIVGAGIGGIAGAAIGDASDRNSNTCVYQRPNGSTYRDVCPRG